MTGRRLGALTAALLVQSALALASSSPLFFRPVVATSQRLFGGSIGVESVWDDVDIYQRYGAAILQGQRPYRDFFLEYPVGALPLFVAPAALAALGLPYRVVFGISMMAFQGATLVLLSTWVARREGERAATRRLVWSTALLAALGPLPVARFDLAPACLAFASAFFWASRTGLGGALAGLGALVKLFPGALVIPLACRDLKTAQAPLLAFAVVVALGALVWTGLGGLGATFRYHQGRGLEIETLAAGVLIVVAKGAGWPLARAFDHTSERLIAPGADVVAGLSPVLALGLVGVAAWRARRRDPMAVAGAAVLAFLLGGKVLSPQYALWVAPFALAVPGRAGRRARGLTLSVCVLTTLVYPWSFIGLTRFDLLAVIVLNARNLLLVALYLALLFGTEEGPPT